MCVMTIGVEHGPSGPSGLCCVVYICCAFGVRKIEEESKKRRKKIRKKTEIYRKKKEMREKKKIVEV